MIDESKTFDDDQNNVSIKISHCSAVKCLSLSILQYVLEKRESFEAAEV